MSGEGMIAEPRAMHGSGVGLSRLKQLMHRGTDFLGCDVAILGGPSCTVEAKGSGQVLCGGAR